jgi:hypothetical protein
MGTDSSMERPPTPPSPASDPPPSQPPPPLFLPPIPGRWSQQLHAERRPSERADLPPVRVGPLDMQGRPSSVPPFLSPPPPPAPGWIPLFQVPVPHFPGPGQPWAAPRGTLDAALGAGPVQSEEPRVVSEEGERSITYRTLEEGDEALVCPILQMELGTGSELAKLPCGHEFDKEALLYWIRKRSASCPSCRAALGSVEAPREEEEVSGEGDIAGQALEGLMGLEALLRELTRPVASLGEEELAEEQVYVRDHGMRRALLDGLERATQEQEQRELQEAILASLARPAPPGSD